MSDLGNESVTVLRAALVRSTDGTGFVRDWVHAASTTYGGCNVQPLSSTEYIQDREFAEAHLRVFGPFSMDIVSTDRVRVETTGTLYEAEGSAQHLRDIDSRPSHTEALIKIMEG